MQEDHYFTIDYKVVAYEAMAVGYMEEEVAQMRYCKWCEVSEIYRARYNMHIKRMIFTEKQEVQSALCL